MNNVNSAWEESPLNAPGRKRLPLLLRRAWFGLNQAFRRRIAHLGITPDQFTALRTILEGDPKGISQRELTERMTSDPNTVASLLERMEVAGWIQRQRHEEDKRAYRITLLPEGRKRFGAARALALDLQAEVLQGWSEERRERFLDDLAEVAEACGRAALGLDRVGEPVKSNGPKSARSKGAGEW